MNGCGPVGLMWLFNFNFMYTWFMLDSVVEWELAAEDCLQDLIEASVEVGREENERTGGILVLPITLVSAE